MVKQASLVKIGRRDLHPGADPRPGEATTALEEAVGDVAAHFEVVRVSRVGAAEAWAIVARPRQHPRRPLLVTAGTTTAGAREILRERGIGYIDQTGNAWVRGRGLLIDREVFQPTDDRRPVRLDGKAGVVAVTLVVADREAWKVEDLAAAAQVSIGLAHRVLVRLEEAGAVARVGKGRSVRRRVIDRAAVLDTWLEEHTARGLRRQTLFRLARTSVTLRTDVMEGLTAAEIDYAITGAAAVEIVAPFATAVPVTELWLRDATTSNAVLAATGAREVAEGANLVVLQAPGDTALAWPQRRDDLMVANAPQVLWDLRRDPRRGAELATHYRREVLGL